MIFFISKKIYFISFHFPVWYDYHWFFFFLSFSLSIPVQYNFVSLVVLCAINGNYYLQSFFFSFQTALQIECLNNNNNKNDAKKMMMMAIMDDERAKQKKNWNVFFLLERKQCSNLTTGKQATYGWQKKNSKSQKNEWMDESWSIQLVWFGLVWFFFFHFQFNECR